MIPGEPLDDQAIGNVPSLGNSTNWFEKKIIVGQLEYTIQQQHDYQNNSKQSHFIKGGNGPLMHCSHNNLLVDGGGAKVSFLNGIFLTKALQYGD